MFKEKELIVSSHKSQFIDQTWWANINHSRAMHKDFYKTNKNYDNFLDKTIPTFVSRLVHSL